MEEFKLEIFERENPGRSFPEHRRLRPDETRRLRLAFARKVNSEEVEGEALLKGLLEASCPVAWGNACAEAFDLAALARSLELGPLEEAYVNWDDFTTIDRVRFVDLAEHFQYFWYPGPDDVWIFDDSLSWLLLVDHGGYVQIFAPEDR